MAGYGEIVDADGKTRSKYNLGGPAASPSQSESDLPDADKPARILEGRKATWAASTSPTARDSLRVSTARSSLEPNTLRSQWPPMQESPKLVQGYLWSRHPAKDTLQETMPRGTDAQGPG